MTFHSLSTLSWSWRTYQRNRRRSIFTIEALSLTKTSLLVGIMQRCQHTETHNLPSGGLHSRSGFQQKPKPEHFTVVGFWRFLSTLGIAAGLTVATSSKQQAPGAKVIVTMTVTTSDYTVGWILEYVRESFRKQQAHSQMSFNDYIEGLWQALEKAGVPGIKKKAGQGFDGTHYAVDQAAAEIRYSAIEALSYLLFKGLLVYTPETTSIVGLRPGDKPYRLTKRGADWASGKDPMPEDSAQYMALLKQLVPSLDPVIEQYVSEGLSAFAGGHDFASAVMVGAASEKAIYLLGDSMIGAFASPQKQQSLRGFLDGRGLKKLFDFLRDEIADAIKRNVIPYSVHEGAIPHLMSLVEAIRVQRNDAVHPQNAAVTPDSVRLSYHAFPHALEKMETLRDWFRNNPASI